MIMIAPTAALSLDTNIYSLFVCFLCLNYKLWQGFFYWESRNFHLDAHTTFVVAGNRILIQSADNSIKFISQVHNG